MRYLPYLFFILGLSPMLTSISAQPFSRHDTLRGAITPERAWWDLTYYHLDIQIDPKAKTITGSNTIQYKILETGDRMQIDLQAPMRITRATQQGRELKWEQDSSVWYIQLENQVPGELHELTVFYEGVPKIAPNAPWDGGLSWDTDEQGLAFAATSCQGEGASLWWPCKDHMYDEPDSMLLSVNVPQPLMNISNGRLRDVEEKDNSTRTFHWFVSNPINNYGVSVNIADYAHFSEVYEGEKGALDCDYYVLKDNLEKAKTHFEDVPRMLEAFEYWFGPYPFYEDGFKLVETPFLGMEHQSAIAYGNEYKKGYLGYDMSGSGWGAKFDYIIIHEAGHEWFANSITYVDIADMWVHEGFTAYSECLYVDYHYGTEAANAYVQGTRRTIQNDRPIIGPYEVNKEGSGDMYFKGANMLHTLRQVVSDDEKWRQLLRDMNRDFYHQTVTTQEIEAYMSQKLDLELKSFFNQYLRTVKIPVLEYQIGEEDISYRWSNVVEDFQLPVRVTLDGVSKWITPSQDWKKLATNTVVQRFSVDPNFYVYVEQKN